MTGRRAALLLSAILAGALAALAGSWAGRTAAPAESGPSPSVRTVRVGPARLVVPAGWRPAPLRSTGIAGLDERRTVAFAPDGDGSARVVATVSAAADASLIPAALRPALLGRPSAAQLGGRPAWLYHGRARLSEVTVLPTTGGTVAIACTAPAAGCASEVEAAAVPGAATLVPSSSLALALRLPGALERLDRDRIDHRAALGRARTGTTQARAARRLAADHAAAAESLGAAAGPAGAPLLARFTRAENAYLALDRAASKGSSSAFVMARGAVQRAEASLASAIAAVPRPAIAPVTPGAAPSPSIPTPSGVSLLLFLALALLAAAAGVAAGTAGAARRLWPG